MPPTLSPKCADGRAKDRGVRGKSYRLSEQNSEHTRRTRKEMKTSLLLAALALAGAAPAGYAQFGSGIVFDPTQSAHAAQQILQANQLYTTTLKTTQNVIGAYNLAQRMSAAPSSLYLQYENLGRQFWVPWTQPADTYGNLQQFINAVANGYGASAATQTASIQRTGQIAGYGSLS